MQLSMLDVLHDTWNYEGKKIMIGLSGGINSQAVLCYLAKHVKYMPGELHLFYAHFDEHSEDTMRFVLDGVRYAFKHFDDDIMPDVDTSGDVLIKSKTGRVTFRMTINSVISFFRTSKMIPHPSISPCTRILKIMPMAEYMKANDIYCDLVGYVRSERTRIKKQQKRLKKLKQRADSKQYLISDLSDDDCLSLVEQEIGWYPKIYAIKWSDPGLKKYLIGDGNINKIPDGKKDGARVKTARGVPLMNQRAKVLRLLGKNVRISQHNNCLPCKNWRAWEMVVFGYFFPEQIKNAVNLSLEINSKWGRDTDQMDFDGSTCDFCAF